MKTDLISTILPIWRPKISELKKAIDSVLSQTFSSLELIIAYKSHPETDSAFYHTMDEYDDKRIHVIECKKKGVSSQTNEAIQISSGSLIAKIDADDYWDSNKLQLPML